MRECTKNIFNAYKNRCNSGRPELVNICREIVEKSDSDEFETLVFNGLTAAMKRLDEFRTMTRKQKNTYRKAAMEESFNALYRFINDSLEDRFSKSNITHIYNLLSAVWHEEFRLLEIDNKFAQFLKNGRFGRTFVGTDVHPRIVTIWD